MKIQPFLLGHGRAGMALQKSLGIVKLVHPQFEIEDCRILPRNQPLQAVSVFNCPVLLIANPHALHARSILEAQSVGFKAVIVEKPACVRLDEVRALESVKIPVAVCHVYRQMWGPQTLKNLLESNELGTLISIEGRYWQSSTAQQALSLTKTPSWKNDRALSGDSDVLFDIGTHWMDAVIFLMGELPSSGSVWVSYANAEASHRDSHLHLNLAFSGNRRAMGSISKTVHGATNHFELNLIGTLKSATWTFLNPDEIWIGEGERKISLVRKTTDFGSHQSAFHALGWLEGYVEIIRQLFAELAGNSDFKYPSLRENLQMLRVLFSLGRV